MAAYRILVVIPHYYNGSDPKSHNRSLRPEARTERAQALAATIFSLRQTFPAQVYGLDHQHSVVWQSVAPIRHELDIVVCTTVEAVLDDLKLAKSQVRHHATSIEPLLLGFECHKILAAESGK